MMRYPLQDVKVLDLSHALAGPFCTMMMGDYGARIYKLEAPGEGDVGRSWGPPFQGDQSSFFLALHRNKLGLSVNLKHPEGRELCLRLMEKVDVVVENFRPGSLERLGLGWAQSQARNPRLIYCSISGYGLDGPSRDLPAMDLAVQASSGLISVTGTTDGEMVRCGYSAADITAGMFAAFAILTALVAREKTGAGQHLDVSMLDSMITVMNSNFAVYLGSGEMPAPMGTSYKAVVPYRTFATADRHIAIAAATDKLWMALCEAIGRPELARDPRYASNALRVENRETLEALLEEVFRKAGSAEWQKRLQQAGVACALVRTLDEVYRDPQAQARDMFAPLEHPSAGPCVVTGVPFRMSETPGGVRFAAPRLGEHTRTVLRSLLCLDDVTLDGLAARGVIQQAG